MRRTFFVLLEYFLQVDLGAEALPDGTQTPAPCKRIGNRVVLVQVMFREPSIHALVREARIQNLVLQASSADSRRDALLHRPPLALYAEDFWAAHHAHCGFVSRCAFGEVNEDTERRREAVSGIRNRGRVVSDEGAELRGRGFGLREDV